MGRYDGCRDFILQVDKAKHMKTPPIQADIPAMPPVQKDAISRPNAQLMRLPERLSAHMQSRSQAGQVYVSDAVMSLEAEMKSLHMAIQYASRASSLIQETEEQTGELLNLVHQIRSMARKMTLPDIREAERQKTETRMNKLWGEVQKFSGTETVSMMDSSFKKAMPSTPSGKEQALANLDKAANQLELQRTALADTAQGVRQTIDMLTKSGTPDEMFYRDPAFKPAIDHVEKSAAVMAERAEITKAAQKKAASALFTQILQII